MVRRGVVLASLLAAIGSLAAAKPALAWTPYLHLYSANRARDALVADNGIRVNGRLYPVRPEVLQAIQRFPEYFNGGVVGPDGMPDVTYGQAIIHPDHSGKWLKYLLANAWSTYQARGGDDEAQKNLAFTYGFLSHGAGDMWGHTYVNDFAEHVFPAVTDIFKNLLKVPPTKDNTRDLATALRHLVAEGYVGDATPGYDGNPDPGPAPGPGCPASNPLCDRSDRSTPGFDLDAPHPFVYDTLINPAVTLPVGTSRGPIIDFFLELRAGLVSAGASFTPDPLALVRDTAAHFQSIVNRINRVSNACADFDLDCVETFVEEFGGSVLDILEAGFDALVDSLDLAFDSAVGPFIRAYLGAWVADIDDGLRHWNEVGLNFSKALFDAQTRRNLQIEECNTILTQDGRDFCKANVSTIDVLLHEENDFILEHLLSMLGLPDLVGELAGAFSDALEAINDVICGVPGLDLVCALEKTVKAEVQRLAEELVEEIVEEVFGIDMEAFEQLTSNLGAYMTLEQILPGSVASQLFGAGAAGGINFFQPGSHDRTDGYLGLTGDHHVPAPEPIDGFPIPAQRLSDTAEFSPESFAAVKNTITQEKLLLLDGAALNTLAGDILTDAGIIQSADKVRTYVDGVTPANVMFTALREADDPWFLLMDGDHSWRQDGLPRFCSIGGACIAPGDRPGPGPVSTRIATDPLGGTGQFPLWESCVLRPAFSALYTDWENGAQQWPAWFDGVSPDPRTDPDPPAIDLHPVGPTFLSGTTLFVGASTTFSLTATDATFTTNQVDTRFRFFQPPATPPAFTVVDANATSFALPAAGPEGAWSIEGGSQDPCHTFAFEPAADPSEDLLPPGSASLAVVLDLTPPVITIISPSAITYDSSDFAPVQATADDGPTGSGVASLTATLDGNSVALGSTIDMFLLGPGLHTVVFTSADNVGNTSTASVTFRVLATPQSLLENLDRARAAGQFPGNPLFTVVRKHVAKALDDLAAGRLGGEKGSLNSALDQLLSARDQNRGEVDPHIADLLIASISEIIATIGHTVLDSNNTSLGVLEKLLQEYVAGNVSAHGAFEQLRKDATQAVDDHFDGKRSQEIRDLGSFLTRVASLLAQNRSPCGSRELSCFSIDPGAATRLTQTAQAVIDAL